MSDFAYGEEVTGYQKELAELFIRWERIAAVSDAAGRLKLLEPLLQRVAEIKREVYAAKRGWDQALDALLDETKDPRRMGQIMRKISENPYDELYRDAWQLQLEINQGKMRAHTEQAIRSLEGNAS